VGDKPRAGLRGRRDVASVLLGEGDEGDAEPLGEHSAAGERKGGAASEGPHHLVSEERIASAGEEAERKPQSAARADAPEEGSAAREARHHGVEAKESTRGAAAHTARADGAMPRDECEVTRARGEVEGEDACSALGTALRGEAEEGSREQRVAAHASVGVGVAACAVLDEVDPVGVVVRVRGKGREAETETGCVPAEVVRGMLPVDQVDWEGSTPGIQLEVDLERALGHEAGQAAGKGHNTLPAGEVVGGTRAGAASR
jgi:hypothetical protein